MRPAVRYLQIEIMLSGQVINVHVPMLLADPKRSTGSRVGVALSATKACCNRVGFEGKGGARAGADFGLRGAWQVDLRMRKSFAKAKTVKLQSTRKGSTERYLVARGYRG